jgi:hypothetical protein
MAKFTPGCRKSGSPLKTLGSHVPEKFEAYNAHTMARPTKV